MMFSKQLILKQSMGRKLTFLLVSLSLFSLLVYGGLEYLWVEKVFKEKHLDRIEAIAGVVGAQSVAAIEFLDESTAKENIQFAFLDPDVAMVCLYDAEGIIFSNVVRTGVIQQCPEVKSQTSYFQDNASWVFVDMVSEYSDEKTGSIFFLTYLNEIENFTRQAILQASILLSIILVVISFLAMFLQKIITKPIFELATVVTSVAKTNDYSVRAKKYSDDELGMLVDSFNEMLLQIFERDKALGDARESAEKANQMKSEFLANMSHELRTPLNSLLILAEDFAANTDGNLMADQIEAAEVIFGSGSDLLALINDILDLAKVEAGKIELVYEPIALADVLRTTYERFSPLARNSNLGFAIDIEDGLPEEVIIDRMRLDQVLRNFISNAFKFTAEGSVSIQVTLANDIHKLPSKATDFSKYICISVVDTGIGIPKDSIEYIFGAFQQADGSTSRKYGGTGLGLSISLELAKLLGGKVSVESEVDVGSVFTLCLPISPEAVEEENEFDNIPEEDAEREAESVAVDFSDEDCEFGAFGDDIDSITANDNVILIIEDDFQFVHVLKKQIDALGVFKCIFSKTGGKGLQYAETFYPNAIILDIELPDISGMKVLERLQSNASTKDIPVYIMSIHDKDIAVASQGIIGYLTKPVSKSELMRAFDVIVSASINPLGSDVLVVEDDPDLRKIVCEMMESRGVGIKSAESAEEALELIVKHKIHCMVLDIGLPGMSGLELLDVLSKDDAIEMPSVIVYSGHDLTKEEEQTLQKYTDLFIQKNGKSNEEGMKLLMQHVTSSPLKRSAGTAKSVIQPDISSTTAAVTGFSPTVNSAQHTVEDMSGFIDKVCVIVSDDMRKAFLLSNLLGELGMKVSIESPAARVVEAINKTPAPDVVIMDEKWHAGKGEDVYEIIELAAHKKVTSFFFKRSEDFESKILMQLKALFL